MQNAIRPLPARLLTGLFSLAARKSQSMLGSAHPVGYTSKEPSNPRGGIPHSHSLFLFYCNALNALPVVLMVLVASFDSSAICKALPNCRQSIDQ